MSSKSIETEAIFTKTEKKKNEKLIFFKIVSLTFITLIPEVFVVHGYCCRK